MTELFRILENQKCSSKIAIIQGENHIKYQDLYRLASNASNILKFIKTDSKNVGIWLPNCIEYAIAYFGILLNSDVVVPIGVEVKKSELASTIAYCEIHTIITNQENFTTLLSLLGEIPVKIQVLDISTLKIVKCGAGEEFTTVVEQPYWSSNNDPIAILLHTSGTTSKPKRVALTHKNLLSNISSNIESLSITATDVCLIILPLIFGYCNTSQFLTHLYLGATIVLYHGPFVPTVFSKLVEKHLVTNTTLVPTMLMLLGMQKRIKPGHLRSLRLLCFGGGVMSLDKLQELIKDYPGIGFVQTYGLTEASPRVTALLPKDSLTHLGSVGKPIPGVEVKIVNPCGEELSRNEIGEIIVYGLNVMKGYYKRVEETTNSFINGWLRTGDLGYFDLDGFLYLVGRKKNIIITGGLNIYPEEIEEILLNHPLIAEAKVNGLKSELLGEHINAMIVLKAGGESITPRQISDYCKKNLSDYKVPHTITFCTNLPKTATGKICRYIEGDNKHDH